MEGTIVITSAIINRLRNMSSDEKHLLLDTLLSEEVLHEERSQTLTPIQEMLYMMLRDSVRRTTSRYVALAQDVQQRAS